MVNSTASRPTAKPRRTSRAVSKSKFPLFKHQSGRWCKKVRGKHRYFGSIAADPEGTAALALWIEQKDLLLNGIEPERPNSAPTVADCCNLFLAHTESLVTSGERSARTHADYLVVSQRLTHVLGRNREVVSLTPDDFTRLRAAFGRTRGAFALSGDIARTKAIFAWAVKNEHLASLPRYGSSFEKPNAKTLRLAKAASGERLFEQSEVVAMLAGASQPLRAMILLALNAGLGNSDIGKLPLSAIDLETGWLNFPRPKTGIARRAPLWPETVASLREWLAVRPAETKAATGLVFVTARGGSWCKSIADNPISKETAKLTKRLGIHKDGLSFYSLRRTFRTVASESRDEAACDAIMGHAARADDMAAVYRQRIGDDRLQAVVDHVRAWLFSQTAAE